MIRILTAALTVSLLTACGGAEAPSTEAPAKAAAPVADTVTVTEARVRATPPGAPNSAAFMTLRHEGEATALVAAKADISQTVELHTHTDVDGMMQMRPVDQIDLPAGEDVVLKPGGLHIMFIGLKEGLTEGGEVALTLEFADGSTKAVNAPIQAIAPAHAGGTHAAMHGAGHGQDEGGCACGMHDAEQAKSCACGKHGGGKHDGEGPHGAHARGEH